VPYTLINQYGAVSGEVAKSMVEGALRHSHAQVALSITGIAGPTGGTEEKPVGLVFIGYANGKTTLVQKHLFGSERHSNRMRSATAAIVLLIEQLRKVGKE